MQDGERRVGRGRRRLAIGQRAGQPEDARRQAGRALEQLGALVDGRLAQSRLEELAHDAEGEVALELGAAGAQDARGAVVRGGARRGEHRRLADPGWPFDDDGRPGAGARAGDRGLDARQLAVALEQVDGAGRRKYQCRRERVRTVARVYCGR